MSAKMQTKRRLRPEPGAKVTLIGVGQAEVGRVFINKGLGSRCNSCNYANVCVKNLEPERIYKIAKVRKKKLACNLHEGEMQVVEVVEAELPAAIASKLAIERAIVTFSQQDCHIQNCTSYDLCFPIGLIDGDRCEVSEIIENLHCSQGLSLKKVLLRRAPFSRRPQ